MKNLKSQFMLEPDVVFLNHGSFGACPRPVFENCRYWQEELEKQPVRFFGQVRAHLERARECLGDYVGCRGDDLVYVPNPTTAINMVIPSLDLQPGDEILATDHEYGALDRAWKFNCRKTGARYIQRNMPLPATTVENFVDRFWSGVTERTRVVFISHITSPTALIFPVREICRLARECGILSIVDGAHAPGHIPLDIARMQPDVYAGACHKWLCAPKGTSFLYVDRRLQNSIEPLVVSWGWESENPGSSQFLDCHQWQGTRDMSAFLSVPAAIQFHRDHDWDQVRERCHNLARETRKRIVDLTSCPPVCPDSSQWYGQMFCAEVPVEDTGALKNALLEQFHIEVPVFSWNQKKLMRVSFQGYNQQQDADVLLKALETLLFTEEERR